jgi:hypothetical protein
LDRCHAVWLRSAAGASGSPGRTATPPAIRGDMTVHKCLSLRSLSDLEAGIGAFGGRRVDGAGLGADECHPDLMDAWWLRAAAVTRIKAVGRADREGAVGTSLRNGQVCLTASERCLRSATSAIYPKRRSRTLRVSWETVCYPTSRALAALAERLWEDG